MTQLFKPARLVLFVLAALCMLITACKKKEIQGPKGEDGAPGGGGNASISNSSIFTIASSEWTSNADSSAWQITINSVLLTKEVVDHGAVKVFVKHETAWSELPNTQGDLFTQFSFKAGSVNLTFSDIHGGLPEKPQTSDYRLVAISQSGKTARSHLTLYSTNNSPAN